MTTVRPPVFPPSPTAAQPQRADPAKLAAQRAFFQAALGQVQAPSASPAPAGPSIPSAPPKVIQKIPEPAADPPARILRPGSLLDIRV